ncbi:MAG: acetolactate synthase small subunit [Pseudomonadota bacterium]
MKITKAESERHVLAVTVDNEPGILAKITGLFTARGYNIDSLTVADISDDHAVSRITIVEAPATEGLRATPTLLNAL